MKTATSVCLVLVLILTACSTLADAFVRAGDEIFFGAYEQDNIAANGKEPISWQVVDVNQQANTMTVVSKYLLDCVQYNKSTKKTSWAKTYLNQWLQSTFVPGAFSEAEQAYLIPIKVSGSKLSVYIPSENEMKKYFTNFRCEATKYALSRGVYKLTYKGTVSSSYWIRMDTTAKWGTFVGAKGSIHNKRNQVTTKDNGVRPVLNLSLDYDRDTPGADLNDLKLGERITINNTTALHLTAYSELNRLGYYPASNDRDFSKAYDSGIETQYILVKMSIKNRGKYRINYLQDAHVEVVFDQNYRFGGWTQQYDHQKPTSTSTFVNEQDVGRQNENYVVSAADRYDIDPGQTGYYCFGCTLPNAVLSGTKPLKMIISIDGTEITHYIRK